MATIVGSSGADTLLGTEGDDLIKAMGGIDELFGGAGDDLYQMYQSAGGHQVTISDTSGIDTITSARPFYTSPNYYTPPTSTPSGWGSAEHIGNTLIVTTPGKPGSFRNPGYGPLEIVIVDHYGDGTVEYLEAGGTLFALVTEALYSGSQNVLMAGTQESDSFKSGSGNDIIFGNNGNDTIVARDGADTVFGGAGKDDLRAGRGDDRVFAGDGKDVVRGQGGNDWIELGASSDKGYGGAGNDRIYGQGGNDRLYGGKGQDVLIGGAGDDKLYGGKGGDTYQFNYDNPSTEGHDIIRDRGDLVPGYQDHDTIEIAGFRGPYIGALDIAAFSIDRDGNHMVLGFGDGAASITVKNQFVVDGGFNIEALEFTGGYWASMIFSIIDADNDPIDDDRGVGWQESGAANELIFCNDEANEVFSDSGMNSIWLGGGVDVLIYKESDPQRLYDINQNQIGGGAVNDIVMDFDVSEDVLDFTEINGLQYGSLELSEDADGDVHIYWNSNDVEVNSIFIELRGVSLAELTESNFVFG